MAESVEGGLRVRKVGFRYSVKVRREAVALCQERQAEGKSLRSVSESLGIPPGTLHRWCQVEGDRGRLRRVEIAPAPVGSPRGSDGSYVLVTPSGYRVEGLGLEELRVLLEGLG